MSKPLDFVTLSLSDQDLRDQVAYALANNIFSSSSYKQNVEVRVDDLSWDEDNKRWEISAEFEVEDRE